MARRALRAGITMRRDQRRRAVAVAPPAGRNLPMQTPAFAHQTSPYYFNEYDKAAVFDHFLPPDDACGRVFFYVNSGWFGRLRYRVTPATANARARASGRSRP